jgi:hypothetical protein
MLGLLVLGDQPRIGGELPWRRMGYIKYKCENTTRRHIRSRVFSNGDGRLSGDQCVDVGKRLILLLGVEAVGKGGWEHERL